METISTFLIENMYLIILILTVSASLLKVLQEDEVKTTGLERNHLFRFFLDLIFILGVLSMLLLILLSFRVDRDEFAVKNFGAKEIGLNHGGCTIYDIPPKEMIVLNS